MFRDLNEMDYNNNYFDLLEQLTITNRDKITFDKFKIFINNLNKNHRIIVFENNNLIKASGTILIENKIIHGINKVGDIEDIVVDINDRKTGLGKKIINFLINIAKEELCYKIILNCKPENVGFYEKCGFIKKGFEMSLYL